MIRAQSMLFGKLRSAFGLLHVTKELSKTVDISKHIQMLASQHLLSSRQRSSIQRFWLFIFTLIIQYQVMV
jgi:hypothetical protein